MAVGIIVRAGIVSRVVEVVPFFKHRVRARGRGLKVVHLRGVGKSGGFGRATDPANAHGSCRTARGKQDVIAVAAHRGVGFQLELGERVVQRGAEPHFARGQISVEHAGGKINGTLAFFASSQPAEPIEFAVIRHAIVPLEAIAIVVVPIHLGGQPELAQVAGAIGPPGGHFASGQCWQQQRREDGDDGNDY